MKRAYLLVDGPAVGPLTTGGVWINRFRSMLFAGLLAVAAPGIGFAQELLFDPAFTSQAAPSVAPNKILPSDTRAAKRYVLPALEIAGFNFLLNRIDYYFIDKEVYNVSFSTFRRNLGGKWVVDTDPFATNQFLHPLQGSIYFGLARSAGLDYWESFGYTVGGSLLWEWAGETGFPSINDLFTTGIGGTFLGEPLFRMASLLLESADGEPGFWREVGAAAISPTLGFDRLIFGTHFHPIFPSRDPAIFMRLQLGGTITAHRTDQGIPQSVKTNEGAADFSMAYGLPGKEGYRYTRPFDYFNFQFTAATANVFANIMSRGLLIGRSYTVGDDYRGVWGLYGSYDYIAPQIFRVSSTAFSLGSTAQWRLSRQVALQGSALGGLGYGAAGTIHGSGERDYHYGATPQGLLAIRIMFGDTADIDITGRQYYVSHVASTENRGFEHIFRGDAAFTLRISGPHAVTLKYIASHRDARYPGVPERRQTVGIVSLAYSILSDLRFGAVE